MELGATLCSKSNPGCSACPVSEQCCALLLSRKDNTVKVTDYPTKVAKAKQRHEFAAVCVVEVADGLGQEALNQSNKQKTFLLVKRPEDGLLAGLWEFPSVLLDEENIDQSTRIKTMDEYLKKLFHIDVRTNCDVILREDVGECVHVFSHIRLRMHVELLILSPKGNMEALLEDKEGKCMITRKWVDEHSIKSMGLTSGVRKVYHMVQDFKQSRVSQPKRASRKKNT